MRLSCCIGSAYLLLLRPLGPSFLFISIGPSFSTCTIVFRMFVVWMCNVHIDERQYNLIKFIRSVNGIGKIALTLLVNVRNTDSVFISIPPPFETNKTGQTYLLFFGGRMGRRGSNGSKNEKQDKWKYVVHHMFARPTDMRYWGYKSSHPCWIKRAAVMFWQCLPKWHSSMMQKSSALFVFF